MSSELLLMEQSTLDGSVNHDLHGWMFNDVFTNMNCMYFFKKKKKQTNLVKENES